MCSSFYFAQHYVDVQREGFKRMGVIGDWENPYLTMAPSFELHVDSGTGVVLILDLRLGQGGLVVGAPVHRLEALIDIAVFVRGTR